MGSVAQALGILTLVMGGLFITLWILMAASGDDTLGPIPAFGLIFAAIGIILIAVANRSPSSAPFAEHESERPVARHASLCGQLDKQDSARRCLLQPGHDGDHRYGIMAPAQAEKWPGRRMI